MLTVWLNFMKRLESYYLVDIKTKLINTTEEKAKKKTLAETYTGTHAYYRLT